MLRQTNELTDVIGDLPPTVAPMSSLGPLQNFLIL
jgi:hypothetical protein